MKTRMTLIIATLGLAIPQVTMAAFEPAKYQTRSGITLTPQVAARQLFDSNLFRTTSDVQSSWLNEITLKLDATAADDTNQFIGFAQLDQGNYKDFGYIDLRTGTQGLFTFSPRSRLALNYDYRREHIAPGTRLAQGREPFSTYQNHNVDALYGFGGSDDTLSFDARTRYELLFLDDESAQQQNQDFNYLTFSGIVYYRVSPTQRGLFELRHRRNRYPEEPSFNSNSTYQLIGGTWEISGQLQGVFKVGTEQRRYDLGEVTSDEDKKPVAAYHQEGQLSWSPRSYTAFDITTYQALYEALGDERIIQDRSVKLAWRHQWQERLMSHSSLGYLLTDYVGGSEKRLDAEYSVQLALTYDIRRWLQLSAEYSRTAHESNLSSYNFNRELYGLTFRISL